MKVLLPLPNQFHGHCSSSNYFKHLWFDLKFTYDIKLNIDVIDLTTNCNSKARYPFNNFYKT